MRTDYLKSFHTVVEFGSFGKASEQTYFTKQSLLNQVSALEDELGFPLLSRSVNGIRLTPPGKRFYELSKKWYSDMNVMIYACRDVAATHPQIHIANPPLPFIEHEALIRSYHKNYPDVDLKILYYYEDENKPLEGLSNEKYDICTFGLTSGLNVKGISHKPIGVYKLYCLVTEEHPLAEKKTVTFQDIAPYPIGVRRISTKMGLIESLQQYNSQLQISESSFNETEFIFNHCLDNGCYLSRAYFAPFIPSLVAIPVVCPEGTDFSQEIGIYYRTQSADHILHFVKYAQEFYQTHTL